AVFGLGKSGMATARQLHLGAAHVYVWDDNEARRKAAADAGLTVRDLTDNGWPEAEPLVLSPGVPLNHPAPQPVAGAWPAAAAPPAPPRRGPRLRRGRS